MDCVIIVMSLARLTFCRNHFPKTSYFVSSELWLGSGWAAYMTHEVLTLPKVI